MRMQSGALKRGFLLTKGNSMLSGVAVKEFQDIYKKVCKKTLSIDEAAIQANQLLNFVYLLIADENKDGHEDGKTTRTKNKKE